MSKLKPIKKLKTSKSKLNLASVPEHKEHNYHLEAFWFSFIPVALMVTLYMGIWELALVFSAVWVGAIVIANHNMTIIHMSTDMEIDVHRRQLGWLVIPIAGSVVLVIYLILRYLSLSYPTMVMMLWGASLVMTYVYSGHLISKHGGAK